ncbi:uncharacterized protein TNCV_2561081 [Trichonephila clavipes]|uniref:Uncharacterized protein n=1 Tax=Trichonephila clavipes TaxID=2585209 RepID=A0A8X6R6J8_TRICX|nr:uncharacterized protein TNCV_2561081 [Trichonephila clavipes]
MISNYNIDNNTLVRVKEKSKSFAVVIPKAMREQTLIACHDDKLPIPTTPWEIVSADPVICLPQTRAGNTNMLVHIDHATRYVVATPSASLGAHLVTDALYHNIILRYGPPNDTPREDQLDLLILARAEAANNVYEAHLENKHRFDLHRRSHSFKAGNLVLYDWPKQEDHKLSLIFKGPFVIVRPVGAVCYEIKSRTLQNNFIKVVHVQHLHPYFKRDADAMQNNTSDEENDSSAENQDPAEDHQEVSVTTESSSSRNHLRRNRRPPKRFDQYVS